VCVCVCLSVCLSLSVIKCNKNLYTYNEQVDGYQHKDSSDRPKTITVFIPMNEIRVLKLSALQRHYKEIFVPAVTHPRYQN